MTDAPNHIWTQPDHKGMAITPVWPYQPDAQRNVTGYIRADLARAAALREAAAIGREMTQAGCTPGKIWRKLDAMAGGET